MGNLDDGTTVIVDNIVPSVDPDTSTSLTNFFSYCGNIKGLEISDIDDNGTVQAIVTFEKRTALNTALILTGTKINDRKINIEIAPEGVVALGPVADIHSEYEGEEPSDFEDRSQTSVIAGMMSAGFDLKEGALSKAIDFDSN
eukprot:TRINITY_DN1161_c0_g1_i4.p1 TRINITY_DN1161_c0_g1~~TRINITY_DN1161_c0_g1_i4.p1  ORF type:complete len:155 (-),score=40.52 TRINITY_DN1161_c0_g1_i4:328-756(-)